MILKAGICFIGITSSPDQNKDCFVFFLSGGVLVLLLAELVAEVSAKPFSCSLQQLELMAGLGRQLGLGAGAQSWSSLSEAVWWTGCFLLPLQYVVS